MALIICSECGKEVSDRAQACPNCGAPISVEIGRETDIALQNQPLPAIIPRKKNKVWIVILAIFIIIAVIASVIVGSLIFLRPQIACSSARKMISEGNYKEAVKILSSIKQTEKTEELIELVNEKVEESIEEIMFSGDYVKALKKLNDYSSLSVYDKLLEEIKYESIAVTCLLNLKPILKNPNSLQANSISFYKSGSDEEKHPYPSIIINSSGQNGFGGYSTSYSIYSIDDLEYLGSCSSLDYDDYNLNNDDEKYEAAVCFLVLITMDREPLNVNIDLNRINKILSDNITPNVEVEQFAESSQTPA